MTNDAPLINALRKASSYREVKQIRQRMDDATARRVIRSDEFTMLDRACLSLCLNFGAPDRFGNGEGAIIHDESDV